MKAVGPSQKLVHLFITDKSFSIYRLCISFEGYYSWTFPLAENRERGNAKIKMKCKEHRTGNQEP